MRTYIDFETLGVFRNGKCNQIGAGRPLLLGILKGPDGNDFQQVVLEPRLHDAARASRRVSPRTFDEALRLLISDPPSSDGSIVAWSRYDLEVIERHGHSASTVKAIAARYENALDIARVWRRRVRPSLVLPLDHRGRETHELKAYMAHAGYRVPRVLAAGQAAGWGRYVLEQIDKAPHGYRGVKPLAKRRWHHLLHYNFHDCAGLKVVHERAARELALWKAYENTTFTVLAPGRRIGVRIGWNPRPLLKLLDEGGARTWAFVTAWNPESMALSRADNDARQRKLFEEAAQRRWKTIPGVGIPGDAQWIQEDSLLILGLQRSEAAALGQKFGQLAIVFGERDGRAELVPCEPRIPAHVGVTL
jgi:hypothetical protein